MRLPRDVDIRSGAFLLFAFVVVIVFTSLAVISVACRVFGDADACIASGSPEFIGAFTRFIENLISVLLALMVGTRTPASPPAQGGRDEK